MNLHHLDIDHATGTQPIRQALQWLSTCLDANRVPWNASQLAAARESLDHARRQLDRDVRDIAEISTYGFMAPAATINAITRAPELVAPGNAVAPVPTASVKLAAHLDAVVATHGVGDDFAKAIREWKEAGMPAADTVTPGNPPAPLLSPHECKAVLADPRGLIVLMDYHMVCQLESDATGAGTTGDDARITELKAIGRAVIEEDTELHEPDVLKEFGFEAATKPRDGNVWLIEAKALAMDYGARCAAASVPPKDADTVLINAARETLFDHLVEVADLMQGSWIAAEDVLRNVKELDVAFNGDGGARAPRLVDILSQVKAVRDQYTEPLLQVLAHSIHLTPVEIQSNHDRVKWAAGLIKQLPETHDGRNSWLMNYGPKVDAS